MLEKIKTIIKEALPDATIYLHNQNDDGEHFQAIVVSPSFESLSLVKQHQIVMKALKTEFDTSLHALALKTLTPLQWEKEKVNIPDSLLT